MKSRIWIRVLVSTVVMLLLLSTSVVAGETGLDVIFVFDASGSMDDDTYCYATNPAGRTANEGKDDTPEPCFHKLEDYEYPEGARMYLPYAEWIGDPQETLSADGYEILVAEAEYFSHSTSYDEHPYDRDEYDPGGLGTFWMLQRTEGSQASGFRDTQDDRRGAHMMHMPHLEGILGHDEVTDASPRLDYDFDIPSAGVWWVWIRAQCGAFEGVGERTDSCVVHWGTDRVWIGSTAYSDFGRRGGEGAGSDGNRWVWVRLGSVSAYPGIVQVNIWGGGSGFRLDKILLTRDSEVSSQADRAPGFIRDNTPTWNAVRNDEYQTYVDDGRYGGPPDTKRRTGDAIDRCNPIYGQRVDLDGDGVYDCDNRLDDIFDDLQPLREAKEAAKGILFRMRARFDQAGLVESADYGFVRRELSCLETRKSQSMPDSPGVGSPDGGDPAWIWCFDRRLDPTGYDSSAKRSPDVTHGSIIGAIEDISPNGHSNIADGMREGMEALDSEPGHYGRAAAIKVMILLTDGRADQYPNTGCADDPSLWPEGGPSQDCVIYYARQARNRNIVVYALGLGLNVDAGLLKAVAAETGGEYYYVPTSDSLPPIFQEIADQAYMR